MTQPSIAGLPVLHSKISIKGYCFKRLSGEALELLKQHAQKLELVSDRRFAPKSIALLDMVLRVIGHDEVKSVIQFSSPGFKRIQILWIGALYSDSFNNFSRQHRYNIASAAQRILESLAVNYLFCVIPRPFYEMSGICDVGERWVREFESIELDKYEVESLRGWPIFNRNGETKIAFSLDKILVQLGLPFCQNFYRVIQNHAGKRSSCGALSRVIRVINECVGKFEVLSRNYHGLVDTGLSEESLRDPNFVTDFLWLLHDFHFSNYLTKKQKSSGLSSTALSDYQRDWCALVKFLKESLVPEGLMAQPLGEEFPEGKPALAKFRDHANHKEADGGKLISTKLLTTIPLQVTDEEVMGILFNQIQQDVNSVRSWLKGETEEIYGRLQRSHQLEASGELVSIPSPHEMISRENPKALANIIRTIRQTYGGYFVYAYASGPIYKHLFRKRVLSRGANNRGFKAADVAYHLALPKSHDMAAYALYLASFHPMLTEAPLLTCNLYNENGRRTGLVETETGKKLIVFKSRKASAKQQDILLTAESKIIVDQIIELTAPLRRYLKDQNDDRWRRLFIFSGGRGCFGRPEVFSKASNVKNHLHNWNKTRKGEIASSLGPIWDSLTLPRLRASLGVLVYIETQSIEKMSEALGNSNSVALKHYLPEPILSFFQERWVRIFQNGIIVSAMKGSPYLIDASDFNTMDEVDEFLRKHSFEDLNMLDELKGAEDVGPLIQSNGQGIPGPSSTAEHEAGEGEILIKIEAGILSLLLGIKSAVAKAVTNERKVSPKALYWARFANEVERHIESGVFRDPFIKKALAKEKESLRDHSFEGLVYV